MPFYTYADIETGEEKEFMLPVEHEVPKDNKGRDMIRVYKSTHHVIPTNLHHEKSASWQQGRIAEKEY